MARELRGFSQHEAGTRSVSCARILIVENEALLSEELSDQLTRMGHVARWASSGPGAIAAAEEFEPDLVLMDIRLPGKVDGIQAAAAIRDRFGTPVIYLTAHSDRATIERAQSTAPSAYLLKPFREGELRAALATALHNHRLEKRLVRRNAELAHEVTLLQKANRELDAVAFSTAHDLRGPLCTIRTTVDLLSSEGQLSPLQLESLEHVQGSVNRLTALVDASLSLPRLDEQALATSRLEIASVLKDVTLDLDTAIKASNARIIVRPGLPSIDANRVLVHQLFLNLIDNSIKFARAGVHPVISIGASPARTRPVYADRPMVEITLQDNGVGFPENRASEIFRPFTRLHQGLEYAGHGLGLATCARIVLRHNGTISAHGIPGEGARFTIVLPQYIGAQAEPETVESVGPARWSIPGFPGLPPAIRNAAGNVK